MERILEKITDAVDYLRMKGFKDAGVGVVLGTGLGSFVSQLSIDHRIPYEDIPHFPHSTVESHKGQLIAGRLGAQNVIVLQGRFHYYEGYSMQQITFPV